MKITRDGHRITINDRAGPLWALGLFLLAGGILSVAMSLGLASNAAELEVWERLAGVGVGLGVIAGAVAWLARSPASEVLLDPTRRRLRLVRRGLRGRHVQELPFDDLARVEIEQGTDSDGGAVWRPLVHLRGGRSVLISELWSHDQAGVRACLAAVADACRLPQPAFPPEAADRAHGAPAAAHVRRDRE